VGDAGQLVGELLEHRRHPLGLLVVGGSFLLITGQYPSDLFDLVLRLDRWQYRFITTSP
jgi:hypothetical protein